MNKVADDIQEKSIAELNLLASALSGRDIRIHYADHGDPTWTNGNAIFVPRSTSFEEYVLQICVQCALLASDSLNREIMKQLVRRQKLADRYLAIEGWRALVSFQDLLPVSVKAFVKTDLAPQPDSPFSSLEIAKASKDSAELPTAFGKIFPKRILASLPREGGEAPSGQHVPRSQPSKEGQEFSDDTSEDDDSGEDHISSPVGGGAGFGKLLQKMLKMVRRIKEGGSPGADTQTHWMRATSRAGLRPVLSTASIEDVKDVFGNSLGVLYPEWDIHRHAYRPDWCTVLEIDPPAETQASVEWLEGYGLRRPLARLGMGLDRFHRQRQGDDIDIDAVIEAQTDMAAGGFPDEYVYIESQRQRRDLSVLILLDISGSVSQASLSGKSVHEQQRSVARAMMTVLYEVGDRVAMYAFHSQGRSAIHMVPVKRFDDVLDGSVMNRLYSLKPGAYSRLGGAVRHGSTILEARGGTSRKLLVVLSDGLAYDHGYEPAYASADVRRALGEARLKGVGCVCLSVGADTDAHRLRQVFGSASHALIPNPDQLGQTIGPLFRAAMQAAELQRRVV